MSATFERNAPVAVALAVGHGAALVGADHSVAFDDSDEAIAAIARLERDIGPRWVWWGRDTADVLVHAGVRPARCSDLDAVHRLINGGWRTGAARAWSATHGLDPAKIPEVRPPDLFSTADETDDDTPVRADGHLAPSWVDGAWAVDATRRRRWAELALEVFTRQQEQLAQLTDRPAAAPTARSESTAELLCAELEHDGLPIDVDEAERIIAGFIGARPTSAADEQEMATRRDHDVLRHLGTTDHGIDLRNPASVKSLLRRAGIEVSDTRAWRLEELRAAHPIVDALLRWRKAERICTTFGYRWIDEHVGRDGRLRGTWSGSDGAAGRMTATAGLHNLPADLRPAIVAEPGHAFVRADLGQIEPRILAAVSGDEMLAAATIDDDMYAPVARRLDVPRDVAKVAVLGAMYGQTTGHGAAALRGLESAYPRSMGFLAAAARAAEGGNDLRTRGGRRVRMSGGTAPDDAPVDERELRSRAAARGRYGRNAMVQGAAAEFFKTWAVIVRARGAALDARVVLCLHDELLVHVAADLADDAVAMVDDALQEAAHRWLSLDPSPPVRFVSDTCVVRRWSDAT